jgi:hypothetical protein
MVGVNALQCRHRRQDLADALQILAGGARQVQATGNDRDGLIEGTLRVGHRVQQPGMAAAAEQDETVSQIQHQGHVIPVGVHHQGLPLSIR